MQVQCCELLAFLEKRLNATWLQESVCQSLGQNCVYYIAQGDRPHIINCLRVVFFRNRYSSGVIHPWR